MSETIKANSRVLAHISLFLEDGSMADTTKNTNEPAWILMGTDEFSPAFEKQVIGLKAGENKRFVLDVDDAFGPSNPENIHFMDITQFPADVELEEGNIVAFEQPSGATVPGLITEVKEGSVRVDFNHPLAGKKIIFDIDVLKVESSQAQSL
ncbi:MAG: FKBP-type peptidyl-prolyl cis-trans isomerase [Pseudomonadota bacterium]